MIHLSIDRPLRVEIFESWECFPTIWSNDVTIGSTHMFVTRLTKYRISVQQQSGKWWRGQWRRLGWGRWQQWWQLPSGTRGWHWNRVQKWWWHHRGRWRSKQSCWLGVPVNVCLSVIHVGNHAKQSYFEKVVWNYTKMSETILSETILSETTWKCLKLTKNVWN
jgi:hypothetical protein